MRSSASRSLDGFLKSGTVSCTCGAGLVRYTCRLPLLSTRASWPLGNVATKPFESVVKGKAGPVDLNLNSDCLLIFTSNVFGQDSKMKIMFHLVLLNFTYEIRLFFPSHKLPLGDKHQRRYFAAGLFPPSQMHRGGTFAETRP